MAKWIKIKTMSENEKPELLAARSRTGHFAPHCNYITLKSKYCIMFCFMRHTYCCADRGDGQNPPLGLNAWFDMCTPALAELMLSVNRGCRERKERKVRAVHCVGLELMLLEVMRRDEQKKTKKVVGLNPKNRVSLAALVLIAC